ncbi:MAG TPA: lytic polysaccharide monooxygenase [Acidimicrobiales bacterium]|nr:lytic polysaccharide monooxygenase [Acidimicrobiales bacterium]
MTRSDVKRAVLLALVAIALVGPPAQGHGSTQRPSSRVHACRFEQPDNPMCAAAWRTDEQALYDWMEVNVPDANGQHQQRIPDGRLCSAGRDKYRAFDAPGEWPRTALVAGRNEVTFTSTAPHATAYFRLFITRAGFDARRDPLRWADLVQVHDSGPRPAASTNTFGVDLPARAVPAILYVIWQRSDSPEAFYACSDITVGGVAPTTSTTTSPVPTTTTTVPSGDEPFSPVAGVTVSSTTTSSWQGGRCVEHRVTNTTAEPRSWEVHLRPKGKITSLWNATSIEQHHAGHEGHAAFIGADWNATIAAKSATTFGMCVDSR